MAHERSQELSERYSREAVAYRDLWAPVLLPLATRPLQEIDKAPVERVLEIGTGVGALLPTLNSRFRGAFILGVDRARGMLALAPRTQPVVIMDAMCLGIAAETIDLALMNFVLFHLPEPLMGLTEASRILKRGGRLVTVTWGSDLQSTATKIWDEELDAHGAPPLPDPEAALALHELVDSPDKMTLLLKKAGFGTVRAWQESCEFEIDADHLTRLRTSLGRSRPRYEGLPTEQRASCLATAQKRFAVLPSEGFLARGSVVYALAVKHGKECF